jgi:hypothetical protein
VAGRRIDHHAVTHIPGKPVRCGDGAPVGESTFVSPGGSMASFAVVGGCKGGRRSIRTGMSIVPVSIQAFAHALLRKQPRQRPREPGRAKRRTAVRAQGAVFNVVGSCPADMTDRHVQPAEDREPDVWPERTRVSIGQDATASTKRNLALPGEFPHRGLCWPILTVFGLPTFPEQDRDEVPDRVAPGGFWQMPWTVVRSKMSGRVAAVTPEGSTYGRRRPRKTEPQTSPFYAPAAHCSVAPRTSRKQRIPACSDVEAERQQSGAAHLGVLYCATPPRGETAGLPSAPAQKRPAPRRRTGSPHDATFHHLEARGDQPSTVNRSPSPSDVEVLGARVQGSEPTAAPPIVVDEPPRNPTILEEKREELAESAIAGGMRFSAAFSTGNAREPAHRCRCRSRLVAPRLGAEPELRHARRARRRAPGSHLQLEA